MFRHYYMPVLESRHPPDVPVINTTLHHCFFPNTVPRPWGKEVTVVFRHARLLYSHTQQPRTLSSISA